MWIWIAFIILVLLIILPKYVEPMTTENSKYMLFPKTCGTQSKAQCEYSRLYDNPRVKCGWDISNNVCTPSDAVDISSNYNYIPNTDPNFDLVGDINNTSVSSDKCDTYLNKSLCEIKKCEWDSIDNKCSTIPKLKAMY